MAAFPRTMSMPVLLWVGSQNVRLGDIDVPLTTTSTADQDEPVVTVAVDQPAFQTALASLLRDTAEQIEGIPTDEPSA